MILFGDNSAPIQVRVKVYGIGGGGCNAVEFMMKQKVPNVLFVTVNTDLQILAKSKAQEKLQIGHELTKGLGAGANPNVGRQAAEESIDLIHESIAEAEVCILIAGMGGGTGTGAAPVFCEAARQQGKLVLAFVTTPFEFEGKTRQRNAVSGIDELKHHSHSLIVIPNDKLFEMTNEDTSLEEAFQKVDSILLSAVSAFSRLILEPGLINLDFADVKAVINLSGQSILSFGEGSGIHRANHAIESALNNVLLEPKKLRGAKGLLLNILGGRDLTLHEVTRCVKKVKAYLDDEANIIFGANINQDFGDKLHITLIATGVEDEVSDTRDSRLFTPQKEELRQLNIHGKLGSGEGSSLFEAPFNGISEDELDVPTYIRRSRRFPGNAGVEFDV